jgi:hypothetical protein
MRSAERGGGRPRFRLATVTPKDAAVLLERPRPGARRQASAVRGYAQAMREVQWILNGMPLILSQGGLLLDGLQRLLACVESSCAFPTLVAEDVREDVLHTIDQQRRRSFAGVLEARGIRHAHALQSALIKLIHYQDGTLARGGPPPSWARMERVLRGNPELEERVEASLTAVPAALPEPVRTPLLFLGSRIDLAATGRLLDAVARPDAHDLAEPGVLLRTEIDRGREDRALRPTPTRLFALAIKALNATMAGERLRRLSWVERAEAFPQLAGHAGLAEAEEAWEGGAAPLAGDRQAAAEIGFAIETVDRAQAEAYLRQNSQNRRVVQSHVDAIARDIRSGRWMVNAQPICFARSGRLLNGQHRLLAVIAAEGAIEVPVVRGLPDAAYATYDAHAKRTPDFGDGLEGFGDRALVAAMANLLWRREKRAPGMRNAKATASEVREIVAEHPRLVELRGFARKMVDHGRSSVMGYGAYVIEREDPALAASFLEGLETGANLTPGHPILLLRRALQRLRRNKAPQDEQLAVLLEGWARYRSRPVA